MLLRKKSQFTDKHKVSFCVSTAVLQISVSSIQAQVHQKLQMIMVIQDDNFFPSWPIFNQLLVPILPKGKLWFDRIRACEFRNTAEPDLTLLRCFKKRGPTWLFTEGDVLELRKPCRSVVTFQKPFSIRGNVVSNTSYKDWVCQPSFETNKPFLTSCQSPPTISGPKE